MAWTGVCYHGTTGRFFDKGIKVNSDYCIDNVLKPFLDRDVPKLFPENIDTQEVMAFHQDSFSSHTVVNLGKVTLLHWKKGCQSRLTCSSGLWNLKGFRREARFGKS